MQFKLRKHHHNNNNPFWPILTRQCSKCICLSNCLYFILVGGGNDSSHACQESESHFSTTTESSKSADSEADSEETLSLALRIWGSDRASCVVFYFLVKLSSFSCNLVLLLGKDRTPWKAATPLLLGYVQWCHRSLQNRIVMILAPWLWNRFVPHFTPFRDKGRLPQLPHEPRLVSFRLISKAWCLGKKCQQRQLRVRRYMIYYIIWYFSFDLNYMFMIYDVFNNHIILYYIVFIVYIYNHKIYVYIYISYFIYMIYIEYRSSSAALSYFTADCLVLHKCTQAFVLKCQFHFNVNEVSPGNPTYIFSDARHEFMQNKAAQAICLRFAIVNCVKL